MLIINKRKKFILKLETVYFAENHFAYKSDADIILFYLSNENSANARAFHTLRIDLTISEDEIFHNFNETTRARIRKANKKNDFLISVFDDPDEQTILDFCESYDEFAQTKGIKLSDRKLLFMAQKTKNLSISILKNKDNETLCGTANIHDNNIMLGMYAFSHFRKYSESELRNRISDANRNLFWELIKHYKKLGFSTLDMGGLGMGMETPDLDNVDKFKLGFGGKVVTLYHFYHANSFLGKMVLWLMNKNKKIEY